MGKRSVKASKYFPNLGGPREVTSLKPISKYNLNLNLIGFKMHLFKFYLKKAKQKMIEMIQLQKNK